MSPAQKRALTLATAEAAERIKRETGAFFSVVLIQWSPTDPTLIVGAQVPELHILADMLRGALARIEDATATIDDRRPK